MKYPYFLESLCIPNIDYGYLDYSLANFYLIEGFYRNVSPLNVTYYLRNRNYICDGMLLVLSWDNFFPTVHEGVIFFWQE